MKTDLGIEARIEQYLAAVGAQIKDRPAAVQAELLRDLEMHLREALAARGGAAPTPDLLAAILADMDPPAAFAAGGSGAGPVRGPGVIVDHSLSRRAEGPTGVQLAWLLLGVCFLLLNAAWYAQWAWGAGAAGGPRVVSFSAAANPEVQGRQRLVWGFSTPMVSAAACETALEQVPVTLTPPVPGRWEWVEPRLLAFTPAANWPACTEVELLLKGALPTVDGRAAVLDTAYRVRGEALRLLSARAAGNLAAGGQVPLTLTFNAPPNLEALRRGLKITDAAGRTLSSMVVGDAPAASVLVRLNGVGTEVVEPVLTLSLPAGLPPATGTLAMRQAVQLVVKVPATLTLENIESNSPAFGPCELLLGFTLPVDLNSVSGAISVAPDVKFTAVPLAQTYRGNSWWECGLLLQGEFLPGQVYTCTLRKSLCSTNGVALGAETARTIQFGARPAALAFALEGRYLPPAGELRVPLTAVNVPACQVTLRPVLPQNLVFYAQREASRGYDEESDPEAEASARDLTGAVQQQRFELPGKADTETRLTVNLRELAGGEPRGVYLVKAGPALPLPAGTRQATPVSRLLVVSDLGVTAKVGRDGALVWVNSLPAARPQPGVAVVLYARNNSELARGVTGADGIVQLTCDTRQEDAEPFLVTAALGTDLTFLPLAGRRTAATAADTAGSGRAYLEKGCEAFVFTDRGIYRPGETVHAKALVRDAQLDAPAPFPCLFRITKPDGKPFDSLPVTLNERGAAEISCVLPDYLPTGSYNVALVMPGTLTVLGSTAVRLEDFVPPQITVAVDALPARLAAGAACDVGVTARHLFGRPAAGLRAELQLTLEPADFKPSQWLEWTFGDRERTVAPVRQPLGNAALNADGHAVFKLTVDPALRPPAAWRAQLEATVLEATGRPVAAIASVAVDPYPYYVGLKGEVDGGQLRTRQPQHWQVVTVRPDGTQAQPATNTLKAVLARRHWESVLRRNDNGTWSWQSQRTAQREAEAAVSLTGGAGTCTFTPQAEGEYVLTLSDPFTGVASSVSFLAAAPEQAWVSWAKDAPDRVELSLDRKQYRPGDVAKLVIKAPFSGPALLTIESDHVLEHRVITIVKNTAAVELPVRAEFAPNVYCAVSLVRPAVAEAVWSAHRAVGAVSLAVQPADRRLQVTLTAPAGIRPQSRLTVRLAARTETGQPAAAAEFTVAAVDEGICQLTDFTTPDPLTWFLAPRRLGVSTSDFYSLLMPLLAEAATGAASAPGGDGAAARFLRRRLNPVHAARFKPVALWAGQVLTDARGEAEVQLDVPEFTGALRLMAVAFDRSRAGMAAQAVTVKRPLVVQPGLPRFAAPGDAFSGALTVFNESGAEREVHWRVTCGGPLSAAQPEGCFTLAAGQSHSAWIELQAGKLPGKALCTLAVSANTLPGEAAGDLDYSETLELPVRPAAAVATQAQVGRLEAGQTIALMPPADWLAESLCWDVQAGARPEVRLQRSLDYLLQYPYGCLEQTTSAAFPLLYLEDLVTQTRPRGLARGETAPFLQAAVLRLLAMQLGDGGFALWPESNRECSWAGLYAIHFLLEAKQVGVPVPAEQLEAALGWVRIRLDQDERGDVTEVPNEERAYACLLLARAGRPDAGWMARLREDGPSLSVESRVRLALALLYAGDPRGAGTLLKAVGAAVGDAEATEAAAAPAAVTSPVDDTGSQALLLAAWVELDPASPVVPPLVRELESRMQAGHWGTTHSDALALMALGKYARATAGPVEPFAATVTPAGGEANAFDQAHPLRHASSQPGDWRGATLKNAGPGPLWYSLAVEGVPATGTVAEGDHGGLKIWREWDVAAGPAKDGSLNCRAGDRLTVTLHIIADASLDNVVITELLPAGLEIENPGTVQTGAGLMDGWLARREARDDRLLLFTGPLSGTAVYSYTVRAVTPGRFQVPAVLAEGMYAPAVRSAHGAGSLEIAR